MVTPFILKNQYCNQKVSDIISLFIFDFLRQRFFCVTGLAVLELTL